MRKTGFVLLMLLACSASADESAQLQRLLDYFLANADKAEAHQLFWADDLVYTSSSGTRTDKASILSGMKSQPEDSSAAQGEATYSGEEVNIRLFGDTAVVTFRLVGTFTDAEGNSSIQNYFNTGTFVKRSDRWQAVAWQATKIPAGLQDNNEE